MSLDDNSYHRSDNADKYRQHTNFVYSNENTREVLKLLDPRPGDVVLDVGCGSGELTARIHAIVSSASGPQSKERGYVFGLDRSRSMIDAAKRSTESDGPCYDVCDGHNLVTWLRENNLVGRFDKVFSNAALHWMKESPSTVIEGMHAALKPSGLLAIEMGGHLNCVGIRSALSVALTRRGLYASQVDPWYFPTAQEYSQRLEKAGFVPVLACLHPRMTLLPQASGLRGWLETFAGPFMNALDSDRQREEVLNEVIEEAKVDMYDAENDQWTLMYVRLRVQARKG